MSAQDAIQMSLPPPQDRVTGKLVITRLYYYVFHLYCSTLENLAVVHRSEPYLCNLNFNTMACGIGHVLMVQTNRA